MNILNIARFHHDSWYRFIVSVWSRPLQRDTKGHQGCKVAKFSTRLQICQLTMPVTEGILLNNTLVVAETNIVTICIQFNSEYCILIRFVTERRRENVNHLMSTRATIYGFGFRYKMKGKNWSFSISNLISKGRNWFDDRANDVLKIRSETGSLGYSIQIKNFVFARVQKVQKKGIIKFINSKMRI